MSEEGVMVLDRYDDKLYKGSGSFMSPQALSEAIRAMHEGNLDASLWIYIGGDPEKVGYPEAEDVAQVLLEPPDPEWVADFFEQQAAGD